MSQYEAEIRLEIGHLFYLVNYHTERKDSIWDDEKEYQEYIDAALDRINELRTELRLIRGEDDFSL